MSILNIRVASYLKLWVIVASREVSFFVKWTTTLCIDIAIVNLVVLSVTSVLGDVLEVSLPEMSMCVDNCKLRFGKEFLSAF